MNTIHTAQAGGITIVATSFPDEGGVDLTFVIQGTEANHGTFNIPLMLADIPDIVEAIADVLGPIYEEFACDNALDTEAANGLGEQILEEMG